MIKTYRIVCRKCGHVTEIGVVDGNFISAQCQFCKSYEIDYTEAL